MTTEATKRGFDVTCPCCNDPEATVSIDLNDLRAVTCISCNETFSPAAAVWKARLELARWERVARWVEMAPLAEG